MQEPRVRNTVSRRTRARPVLPAGPLRAQGGPPQGGHRAGEGATGERDEKRDQGQRTPSGADRREGHEDRPASRVAHRPTGARDAAAHTGVDRESPGRRCTARDAGTLGARSIGWSESAVFRCLEADSAVGARHAAPATVWARHRCPLPSAGESIPAGDRCCTPECVARGDRVGTGGPLSWFPGLSSCGTGCSAEIDHGPGLGFSRLQSARSRA